MGVCEGRNNGGSGSLKKRGCDGGVDRCVCVCVCV